ncbi:DUF2304 domain-containing protein [uncultured Leifsonia sp.]|uniref:DUF2304 domain-containing protein n=1 Tax=uncultured Leifsonia sp. TaxID=340359 RepID=UPI0025E61A8A|nr:DUF2304 domain-containing protein [uncultured Leifsonia sp.]
MSTASYVFGIVAALLTLFTVIELLRRRRLRERHIVWWLIFGVLVLIIAVFPSVLVWLASAVGIAIPINFVFFVSIIALFLVSLQQSAEATRLENKTRVLAEDVALLELRVRDLEDSAGGRDRGSETPGEGRSDSL